MPSLRDLLPPLPPPPWERDKRAQPVNPPLPPPITHAAPLARVSQEETVAHQKREITKVLTLLETHLRQGGLIGGQPCDCIQKHMLELEALAEETAGITGEARYTEMAHWARDQGPKGTPAAIASQAFQGEYVTMAGQARLFRKRMMEELS